MRYVIPCLLITAFSAGAALAQTVPVLSDVATDRCLKAGPHFDGLIDAAKKEEWTPLADDMAMAFTPVSDPLAMQGWMTGDGETGHFEALVVFKSRVGEKLLEGCTIALGGVDGRAFEKVIVTRVGARPVGQDDAQDTVYKRFSANIDGRDVALTISLPRYPKGSDQVVVSLVAELMMEN